MKHEIKSRYPASSDVVICMFCDAGFHTAKLRAMGLKTFEVLEQDAQGEDFHIRIQRKVPLDAPALVRKVVPAETSAISDERWNRKSKKGRVTILLGIPVDMHCEASMADVAGECVVTYLWEVRSKVPLIGGPLEKFICSDLQSKMVDETRAAATLLKDYRQP